MKRRVTAVCLCVLACLSEYARSRARRQVLTCLRPIARRRTRKQVCLCVARRPVARLLGVVVLFPLLWGCLGPLRRPPRPDPQAGSDRDRKGAVAESDPKPKTDSTPHLEPPLSQTAPAERLRVKEETIEAGDLWKDVRDELAHKRETLSPAAFRSYVRSRAAELIENQVTETLLYQHAKLRLSPQMDKKVDEYVDAEIRKTVSADFDGRQRRFEKSLQAQGQSLQGVREKLRREIVIQSFLEDEIKPKIVEPTRQELLAAFQTAAASFRRPPRRRMSLIDVRVGNRLAEGVEDATREQIQAARAAARQGIQTALEELKSGNDFADVARRWSDGLHAQDGGAWGWVTPGSVRERFEPAVDVLYQLDEGEVSSVVEGDDGFFLVRCDEIDPGVEPDFQTLQPQLIERYTRFAYHREVMKLVARLRREARIDAAKLERFHGAVVSAALDLFQNAD